MTMKPIRSNELNWWKEFVKDKFYDKNDECRTEISQQAQDIVDNKEDVFIDQCGIKSLLNEAEKKYAKYEDFKTSKLLTEDKLFNDYVQVKDKAIEKLKRLAKVRKWSEDFDLKHDIDPSTIKSKLREVAYDEAYNNCKKQHKIYNILQKKKEACEMAIHTGGEISDVVKTLCSEMKSVAIEVSAPQLLLGNKK